ncbi:MAG: vWA domain-containing protein, partial [Desulfobacterales bacterium]
MSRPISRYIAIPMSIIIYFSLIFLWANNSVAQQCKPLLIPNKKALFQRVISHPGANLYISADKASPLVQTNLKPFTVFYIYERKYVGDIEWLKVGPSSNCQAIGWIIGDFTSEWRQSLTLIFTERSGRKPVLFFNNLKSLEQVAGSASPGEQVYQLTSNFNDFQSGRLSGADKFPILAVEPQEEAVSRQRFYLMPIFQTVELFEGVKFLEVASIDPGSWELPGNPELRTAIVFVIDTTISMKPYIERTRKAVRRIYDAIDESGLSERVGFGLVAFRSSIKKTPSIEYVSKVISDIKDGTQRMAFEQELAGVEEAKVSTHSFNEDALAGLKTAIEELNWNPYQSRLIFLITDAGAIRNDDPFSTTGMNEIEVADIATAHGAKVFVLHIKTPMGKRVNNFHYAETQYRALTGQLDPTIGDVYVPIAASRTELGVQTFGRVVEGVAGQMVELVRS